MTAEWHVWELPSEDLAGSFNARARAVDQPADDALRRYLSLDDDGVPLARSAFPPVIPDEPEEYWEVDDYVDIPSAKRAHA